jgi:hypothetical protein
MRRGTLALGLLACCVALHGCGDELFDSQCNLVTLNDSRCTVTVFVDGRQAFTLHPDSDRTLDDIGPGRHVLEAIDASGNTVVRRSVELTAGEDFYWTVDHCAAQ